MQTVFSETCAKLLSWWFSIRHNELREELMNIVCHNVGTEPSTDEHLVQTEKMVTGLMLQQLLGVMIDNVHFDIRVFNPLVPSYQNTPLAQWNEQEKKQAYDQRVRETEHGSFSPLVFTTSGTIATVVYKRLASMIAESMRNLTAKLCNGSDANSVFHCYALPCDT